MKTIRNYLVIILMLLMALSAKAQEEYEGGIISFSISQDLRFMTIGDRERGYDAYTRDLLFKVKLQGYKWSKNTRGILYIEYENADIEYGYHRAAVGFGVSFDVGVTKKLWIIPEIDWKLIPYASFGGIDRGGKVTTNGNLGVEHIGRINDWLSLSATHQLTERKDLGMIYGDTKWKYSFFVGLEFDLVNLSGR